MSKFGKKVILTIFTFVISFSYILNVRALMIGTLMSGKWLKASPSDTSERLDSRGLDGGDTVTVLEQNIQGSGCSKPWLKVITKYNVTGYICGAGVSINNSSATGDNIYVKSNYDNYVNGDGTVACYEDTADWTLSKSVGGSSTGVPAKCGDVVTINNTQETSSGNCRYYYNVTKSDGNSGWLCGYYVSTNKLSSTAKNYYTTDSLNNYYNTLKSAGFPESYLPYLAEMHARHPNWKFESEKINLDFGEIINAEAYGGRSLLQGSSFDSNYYSTSYGNYDVLNNTFAKADGSWYNASTEAIAFYIDPRNYLNEKYIFAFETSRYNNNQNNVNAISAITNNVVDWTKVYEKFPSNNINTDIITASSSIGMNPFHIASRIKQEITGISATDLRLGGPFKSNDTDYSGYYNFFNWGVNETNYAGKINGMKLAITNGWNTPYKSVYGGTSLIYNKYVYYNQDTKYYEKFDVSSTDDNYTHQYMQNLAAPIQETSTTFKTYVNNINSYYNSGITFTIPIYNNMPNYAVTSPTLGNPNNYLKSLKINGSDINGFSYDSYTYSLTLPTGTNTINVNAEPISSTSKISGNGSINISGKNNIDVIVTSASGKTRTYKVNINYSDSKKIGINDIMSNSGAKYNNSNIYGISENTSTSSIINNIKNTNSYANANIYDKNGRIKNNDIFKTGDKVVVSNGETQQSYNVVIYGDINGDGVIDKLDYLAVLRMYYGYVNYDGVYKIAADANRDGKIDKLDYLAILRDYYGYASVNQN